MSPGRLRRTAALVTAVVGLSAVALTGPALAHIELERSEPSAGAVLRTPPDEVFLRFTGAVEEGAITIVVRGPDGEQVTAGDTQSGGRAAAVDLVALTGNGVYRVRYEGVAADGHPVEGRLRFRLRLAQEPTAGATEPTTPPQDPVTEGPAPVTALPSPAGTTTAVPAAAPATQPTTVPWWPFALLLGIAAVTGITLFRRR